MNHGTGLAALPTLEERSHRGLRFDRAKPVQIELGIGARIEQLVARVERGMPTSSTSTHVHLRLAARDASPDQHPTLSQVTSASPARATSTTRNGPARVMPRHTYGEDRVASRPRYT